jgi:hypothetical protein
MAHLAEAIGLAIPVQTFTVGETHLAWAGRASPSLALLFCFGEACELADPRLGPRPVKVHDHLVGGAIELRPSDTPIRAGDVLTTVGRIADVYESPEGDKIVVDTATTNQAGDLVVEGRFTYLLPIEKTSASRRPRSTPPIPTLEHPTNLRRTAIARFDFVRLMRTPSGGPGSPAVDSFRMAVDTLIEELAGSDPMRLRSVRGVVLQPVPPGSDLILHGRRDPKHKGSILFEAILRGGGVVVGDGAAEISQ